MKKLWTLLTVFVLLFTGCHQKPIENEKLKIYASFDVMKDLTQKITKDLADVHLIVESGEEAHDYELSTKQFAEIIKADVVIYNGLGMEPWIDKVKENAKNVSFVDTSYGVEVIKGDHHHEGEDHDHQHEHGINPHIWTSIKNAKKQLTNIKEQLVKIDAKNKDAYEKNYQVALREFNALEKEYEQLKNVKHKTVIVSHAAYTYLLEDYGLEEHAVSGISPSVEPDLAKLAKLTKLIQDEKVSTIFFDESVSDRVSQVLAKEANVKTAVLYSLEKYPKNEDYISLMKKNLESLMKALNE